MKSAIRILIFLLPFFSGFVLHAQQKDSLNKQLLTASYEGKTDEVLRLLEDSADINTTTEEGITPLMYASEKGYVEIVKILLFRGADPNKSPENGRTALISAAINNHSDIVYLLLIYGAYINAADEYGVTALIYAASYNHYDMTEYLLINGAQHVIKAQDGTDALLSAAYHGNTEIVNLLCNYNADINTADYQGFTPFAMAISHNDLYLTETLINRQAAQTAPLKKLRSVNLVDYARIWNRQPLVKRLKKEGLHGSFWPFFNKLTLNYHVATFNTRDYFMGGGIGIFDSKYGISIELGLNGRVRKKRVLEQQSEGVYFQVWEKRNCVFLGVEKLINIPTKKSEHRQGIYLRAKGLLTYGSYEGLYHKPKKRFTFSPGIGYSYWFKNFFLKAGYEYCDLGIYKDMDHWITLSAGVAINLSKSKLEKKIYWM
ncbi:MAG: ankyrin repeat domain-containing protein [Bacteroidales bacterium]|nr:ankyrin repeat domain-containing protein [Bacteroidales bacterium]